MDRIEKLRKNLNGCAAYITSPANVFYYSGFTSPDASLLISENDCFIYTDSRYTLQAKLESPVFELKRTEDGIEKLFSLFEKNDVILDKHHLSAYEMDRIKKLCPSVCFYSDEGIISKPRMRKDASEISKIAEAERLGDEAFSHILGYIKTGMTEREVALELEFFMRKNGASKLSFDTISASGPRSAMPHGTASDRQLERGDLFTLDFGCVLDGYCSDMTRTIGIGELDSRAKEIYYTVLDAQQTALRKMSCGMRCAECDALSRDVIKNAGFGEFFGHSLGHSVGIEIHEAPNLSPKSSDFLQEGNVVTVEPGIYIEGFGGVRIEDLVVIEKSGLRNLTHSSKELIII